MGSEALSYRVWKRIIAVDDIYLAIFGTMDVNRTRHVVAVVKGLQTFAGGFSVDEYVDVDLCRYRVFSEW